MKLIKPAVQNQQIQRAKYDDSSDDNSIERIIQKNHNTDRGAVNKFNDTFGRERASEQKKTALNGGGNSTGR